MDFRLDPRTKLFMVLVVSTSIMLGESNSLLWVMKIIMTMIPIGLLIVEKKYSSALKFALAYGSALILTFFYLSEESTGMFMSFLIGYCGLIVRFMPAMITAWYVLRTTKTDEFMAAMQKMHIPDGITVSLAVVMRFFPTIKEEYCSIQDAMKMRGVMFGGGNAAGIIEYRLIPLLFSLVNIGDELSAAAVTKGLGGTKKRTSIVELRLKAADYVFITFFALSAVLIIYFKYLI